MTSPLPVFIHLPKTAGTAFRMVIEHNVPSDDRIEIYRVDSTTLAQALWANSAKMDRAKVILGHIECRVAELLDRECRYFTILRDPVERVLSLYKFIKYDFADHPAHHRFKSGELTLEQWIDRPMASNVMTKMISGCATEYEPSTPAMLRPAMARLKNMAAVGIQEHYNESVDFICAALDWEPVYGEKNRSSMKNADVVEKEEIGPGIIDEIRRQNVLDVELYQAGLDILKSRRMAAYS